MAEPLSVVASAVGVAAFAQQLAHSVLKIKTFCTDVKNAPTELQETLDQIENISNIMARLGREEAQAPRASMNEDILDESLKLCQKAVERIAKLASELQGDMKQSKMRTSVRTVLKQDTFQRMLVKLDRSKSDLHFAYSMYADARKSKELEHLRQYMDDMRNGQMQMIEYTRNVSLDRAKSKDLENPDHRQRRRTKGKSATATQSYRIQLPLWLCQYAWDVALEKASGRWTISLTSFQIFDAGGSIWKMCADGDINGIRDLLDRRQLSIHDRDDEGLTLACIAAQSGQTTLARFLIESGAEPIWKPSINYSSLMSSISPVAAGKFWHGWDLSLEHIKDHTQFLLDEYEILHTDDSGAIDFVEGDEVIADLHTFSKDPSSLTCEEWLRVLLRFTNRLGPSLKLLWKVLGAQKDESAIFHAKAPGGYTLLHVIAVLWIGAQGRSRQQLSRLIGQSFRAGADLHALGLNSDTPLMHLLGIPDDLSEEAVIRSWVESLADAGADLEEYGLLEWEHMRRTHTWRDISVIYAEMYLGFSYGPRPSDWHLLRRHPGDGHVGQFWRVIENPELETPGAWIDDIKHVESWEEIALETKMRRSGVKIKRLRRMQSWLKPNKSSHTELEVEVQLLEKLRNERNLDAEYTKMITTSRDNGGLGDVWKLLRDLPVPLRLARATWSC